MVPTLEHSRRGVIVKWDIFNHVFLCVQRAQFVPNQNRLPCPGIPDQHDGPTMFQEAVHEVTHSNGLCSVDQTCLHMGNKHTYVYK